MTKPIDLHIINVENEYKRAINHAFDLGWDACEERIIKLLEENVQNHNLNDLLTPKLIALIKGNA